MKPLVIHADPEPLVVDYLAANLDDTVGVGPPPDGWNVDTSETYLGVFWDGTPRTDRYVAQHATIRLTAFGKHTGPVKAAALEAQAHLSAHPGSEEIAAITPLTGVLPAYDDDLRAEMASFTVRVTTRTTPLGS